MEYSPECAIPYLSRVDAGTIDFVRRHGVRVISSGDLVGRFEAAWDAAAIATHRAASEKLYQIKDRAFEYVGAKLSGGDALTEYEVQQQMVGWFRKRAWSPTRRRSSARRRHAGNPHYAPSPERSRAIRPNEVLLLDLWGKLDRPGAVYADITWCGVLRRGAGRDRQGLRRDRRGPRRGRDQSAGGGRPRVSPSTGTRSTARRAR